MEPLEPRILLSADLPLAEAEVAPPPDPPAADEVQLPDVADPASTEQHAPRRELGPHDGTPQVE